MSAPGCILTVGGYFTGEQIDKVQMQVDALCLEIRGDAGEFGYTYV